MKRMETVDDELLKASLDFIERPQGQKPFFVWFNPTRMHYLDPAQAGKSQNKTGLGVYPDGMVEK